MFVDLPLDQLRTYAPERQEPVDFDAFWGETLTLARSYPLAAEFAPFASPLRIVEVFDVTYSGFNGQRIKAWLLIPRNRTAPLPCVVEFIGYGGGRGQPHEWLFWSSAGYAHLVMDTRGQGSTWRQGDTPDLETDGGNPQFPGFMTRGILDPRTYYYRRVFTDAVRAVEVVRNYPAIDPRRIVLSGGSQGGGITLAVAGLLPDVAAIMPDVPFLCHYRVATEITDAAPYSEIANFCKVQRRYTEQVFQTLSYFDGLNFAARAKAPSLFSVALMDTICPPRTVFAAYNHYGGSKSISVWPYNGHEGGEAMQTLEKAGFLEGLLNGM